MRRSPIHRRSWVSLGPLPTASISAAGSIREFPPEVRGYIYQMRCSSGNVYLWMAVNDQGKIVSFVFKNRFDVENVTPSPSSTPQVP